jgi:hypothetical protein
MSRARSAPQPRAASRVPARLRAVWWTRDRGTAEQILIAIGEAQPATAEQAIAAGRLGVALNDHGVVLARAQAAVCRLDGKLTAAQTMGDLKPLNREYKRRRLEAERSGRKFMSYSEAQRRLRKALASAAATGSMPELMAAVRLAIELCGHSCNFLC